jgi:hypothetical protein
MSDGKRQSCRIAIAKTTSQNPLALLNVNQAYEIVPDRLVQQTDDFLQRNSGAQQTSARKS